MFNVKSLWVHLFWALVLSAVSFALLTVGWWSLMQTIEFSGAALTQDMALPIGIVIQFGQNAALYAKHTIARPGTNDGLWFNVTFAVLGAIDAITNYGQYFTEHGENWASPSGVTPIESTLGVVVGMGVCALVIFVEEFFALTFALCLNKWNEVIKAAGYKGFPMLDVAAAGVSKMGFSSGGGGKSEGHAAPPPPPQKQGGGKQAPPPANLKGNKPPQGPPPKPKLVQPGDPALGPRVPIVDDDDFGEEDDLTIELPEREEVRLPSGEVVKLFKPKPPKR